MKVLILLSLITLSSSYTDPVLSPTEVTDEYGNTADASSGITWADLPEGQAYATDTSYDEGSLAAFYNMVRGFCAALLPGDPPYEIIGGLLDGSFDIGSNWQDLAFYAGGFAFAILCGLFFMIVMPIVCCCFCCCRVCCKKCGGRMVHKPWPDPKSKCKFWTWTALLSAMTLFMGLGGLLSYVVNGRFTTTITYVDEATTTNLKDITIFMNNTIDEIRFIALDGYSFTGEVVKRDLSNIGALLGVPIRDEIDENAGINDAIDAIITLEANIDESSDDLHAMNHSQVTFENALTDMDTALSGVASAITTTQSQSGCAASCAAIDTSVLDSNLDATNLPDLTTNLALMDSVQSQDLTQSALDGKQDFDRIPGRLENDTEATVQEIKDLIDEFYTTVEDQMGAIDGLTSQTDALTGMEATISEYMGYVVQYDSYRSYAGFGLVAIVFIICLIWIIALIMGCITYKNDTLPTERSKASNCAGCLSMLGVALCMIFSALLMLLVFIPFLIGEPLQRFLCAPLMDPEYTIFKELFDSPDNSILGGDGYFLSNMLLQDGTIELTFHGMLEDCKNEKGAFEAMKLSEMFDLSVVTSYRDSINIVDELSNLDVDLTTVEILSADTTQQLNDFKDSVTVNYTQFKDELAKSSTANDLAAFAQGIRDIANDGFNSDPAKAELLAEADDIDDIVATEQAAVESAQAQLLADVDAMESSSATLPDNIDSLLAAAQTTEDYVQGNAVNIVAVEAGKYAERILNIMDQFANNTLNAIQTDIANCRPIWNLWESVIHNALCNYLVLTLNSFWFALGWSVFFMIPGMIFGTKLARFLRRMKELDGEDVERPHSRIATPPTNKVHPQSPPPSYPNDNELYGDKALKSGVPPASTTFEGAKV